MRNYNINERLKIGLDGCTECRICAENCIRRAIDLKHRFS
jgi:ferredoxin